MYVLDFIWWIPKRISYYRRRSWRTVNYPDYRTDTQVAKCKSLAVSPIDINNMCNYLAFDIDSDSIEEVQAILNTLPEGTKPLVSFSGNKGFHVWIFPLQPIQTSEAIKFLKLIQDKTNIQCEIFPSSENSKCLKWPLSQHPKTKKQEVFINPINPKHEYDTLIVLEGLHSEMWRTPSEVIENFVKQYPKEEKRKAHTTSFKDNKNKKDWLGVFRHENAGFELLKMFDIKIHNTKLGKAFCCPIHKEKNPSANFIYDSNGFIAFHDWHCTKYGLDSEFYTLPELYCALKNKSEITKLDPQKHAEQAKELAFLLGYRNSVMQEVLQKWLDATKVLYKAGLLSTDFKQIIDKLINTVYTVDTIFKTLIHHEERKLWMQILCGFWQNLFDRVWVICLKKFFCEAFDKLDIAAMSNRWLARQAKVRSETANKALNLLCVLGILEKCEIVMYGNKLAADRFKLCSIDSDLVLKRYQALGKPSLKKFNRNLVAEKLGEDIADAVFRRSIP
ncbi:hypothetical protein SAMN02745218_02790 [Desulfofundulus australicus DSM 11792]|uniref:TOTE conflict system primase domain-containing protein n=1 Tax=Desulfofundulus australicus DSM 11792 TaxID=1121425 RepID=A0A1M5DD94_9FIRM|nr:hypothetical protein [Desulfofundulus australicus]SHF64896.1 hypothetical protein SAMN02745218_02790 [Desulfofundulus australicus DSM 11792]